MFASIGTNDSIVAEISDINITKIQNRNIYQWLSEALIIRDFLETADRSALFIPEDTQEFRSYLHEIIKNWLLHIDQIDVNDTTLKWPDDEFLSLMRWPNIMVYLLVC